MADRNPKADPRPGDVLVNTVVRTRFKVLRRDTEGITVGWCGMPSTTTYSLEGFRRQFDVPKYGVETMGVG